jgi:hypothetical protein
MHTRILRSITVAILGVAVGGCAAVPTIQTTKPANPATPIPSSIASAHEVAETTTLDGGSTGPATATCPQGEFALGGGWSVPAQGARVFAARASGATWAVWVLPLGHPATTHITAYVECLRDAWPGMFVRQATFTTHVAPTLATDRILHLR